MTLGLEVWGECLRTGCVEPSTGLDNFNQQSLVQLIWDGVDRH